jgi:hypothetical protein
MDACDILRNVAGVDLVLEATGSHLVIVGHLYKPRLYQRPKKTQSL